MFFVYVLQSLKDKKCYIGHTDNLERRLEEHNRGKSLSVRNRGPFKIINQEANNSRLKAIQREKQIKRYKGGEAFKKLINKDTFDPMFPAC